MVRAIGRSIANEGRSWEKPKPNSSVENTLRYSGLVNSEEHKNHSSLLCTVFDANLTLTAEAVKSVWMDNNFGRRRGGGGEGRDWRVSIGPLGEE